MKIEKFNEKKWQAEQDAETLARYQEIMESPARKRIAENLARSKARDLMKRSELMKKASGGSLKKSK